MFRTIDFFSRLNEKLEAESLKVLIERLKALDLTKDEKGQVAEKPCIAKIYETLDDSFGGEPCFMIEWKPEWASGLGAIIEKAGFRTGGGHFVIAYPQRLDDCVEADLTGSSFWVNFGSTQGERVDSLKKEVAIATDGDEFVRVASVSISVGRINGGSLDIGSRLNY
jgi:hypothetical protein